MAITITTMTATIAISSTGPSTPLTMATAVLDRPLVTILQRKFIVEYII